MVEDLTPPVDPDPVRQRRATLGGDDEAILAAAVAAAITRH
jgi:hypothetical protein